MLRTNLLLAALLLVTGCASVATPIPPKPPQEKFNVRVIGIRSCDFAGQVDALENKTATSGFKVVMREEYEAGNDRGFTDYNHTVGPGGRKEIGCSNSQRVPLTKWTRYIISEVPVK